MARRRRLVSMVDSPSARGDYTRQAVSSWRLGRVYYVELVARRWFEEGTTDSRPKESSPVLCLGFLEGSRVGDDSFSRPFPPR